MEKLPHFFMIELEISLLSPTNNQLLHMAARHWGLKVSLRKKWLKAIKDVCLYKSIEIKAYKFAKVEFKRIVAPKNVKELNEAPSQGVPVSYQQAYTTAEPVEHRVSVVPRRQPRPTAEQAEIDDDDLPF